MAGAVIATPLAAGATMPHGPNNMDDMTAAPGAPVDFGYGPGKGRHPPARHDGKTRAPYVLGGVSQGGPNAGVAGYFDPPVPWPIIGLHEILLPDGRVMNYGTDQTGKQGAQFIYDIWDPTLGTGSNAHTVLPNTTSTDIFCSYQALLWTTGQVLITGGDLTISGKRNYSNNNTTVFDPATNAISTGAAMQYPRWYPSIVDMPNGDMVVLGGRLAPGAPATRPEVFNPASGWRTLTDVNSAPAFGNGYQAWFYPKGFLAPNGLVFIAGYDGRNWFMNTSGAGVLKRYPQIGPAGSNQLPTVMYAPGKILSVRGTTTETIDINGKTPVITPSGNIDQLRYWSTGTVLADGTVAVTGGSTTPNELINVDYTTELWNPATGVWTEGAQAENPRLYHSIALLLPDATLLTGSGGAPGPISELNAEIYYPPYLYLNDGSGNPAPRPTLVNAPQTATIGGTVTATVGVSDTIGRVTFLRTGSDTHLTNLEQRFIDAPFTQSGSTITATLPSNPNVMTPGYYMMFVHQNGVPSVSQIILVTQAGDIVSPNALPARRGR